MSKSIVIVGTYSAIYVGNADNTNIPLVEVVADTTGPYQLSYNVPETEYVPSIDSPLQEGLAACDLSVTFLTANTQVHNLVLGGLPSSDSFPDEIPTETQKFSVFLIHPLGDTSRESIYIPKCFVRKQFSKEASKTDPTVTPIQFYARNPSRHIKLFYQRTNTELATVMGGQYPL